jgi:hypothetical protein
MACRRFIESSVAPGLLQVTQLTPGAAIRGAEFHGIPLEVTITALLVVHSVHSRNTVAAFTVVAFHLLHLIVSKHLRRVIIIMARRTGYQALIRFLGLRMTGAARCCLNRLIDLMATGATMAFYFLEITVGKAIGSHALVVTVAAVIAGIRREKVVVAALAPVGRINMSIVFEKHGAPGIAEIETIGIGIGGSAADEADDTYQAGQDDQYYQWIRSLIYAVITIHDCHRGLSCLHRQVQLHASDNLPACI